MDHIKSVRHSLHLSQIRLALLSGVSRFKICLFERGEGLLSEDERSRISAALQVEAQHLKDDGVHRSEVRALVGKALNLAQERDYPVVRYHLAQAYEILGLPSDRHASTGARDVPREGGGRLSPVGQL